MDMVSDDSGDGLQKLDTAKLSVQAKIRQERESDEGGKHT